MSENVLDTDLTDVQVGMPLIADGEYKVHPTKIEQVPNSSGDGDLLKIDLALDEVATTVEGKQVNPGFPIYTQISLKVTDKYDPKPRLKEFRLACTGDEGGKFLPLEQYIGKQVVARVGVQKERDKKDASGNPTGEKWPARNEVRRFRSVK